MVVPVQNPAVMGYFELAVKCYSDVVLYRVFSEVRLPKPLEGSAILEGSVGLEVQLPKPLEGGVGLEVTTWGT